MSVKSKSKSLRSNLIILSATFINILIVVFLIIPVVREIFEGLTLFDQNNQQLAYLRNRLTNIVFDTQNTSKYSTILTNINNSTLRNEWKIIEYRNEIANIIYSFGLNISREKLSENIFSIDKSSVFMREVPFEFDITGDLESIKSFIRVIDGRSDLIIIKEMSLTQLQSRTASLSSSTISSDQWLLRLTLVKYNFQEDGVFSISVGQEPETANVPAVVEKFFLNLGL